MPYNGVGVFIPLSPPVYPAVPNTFILASSFNSVINDILTGLSSVMTRDGQAAMIANLPMGGFKVTNLGNGVNPGDAVNYAQVFTNPTIANPVFTGTPTAPTAAPGTNSTQIATTAYVDTADALKAPLASPALTGIPTAPTAPAATNDTQLATTAFVYSVAFSLTIPDTVDWASFQTFQSAWAGINALNS